MGVAFSTDTLHTIFHFAKEIMIKIWLVPLLDRSESDVYNYMNACMQPWVWSAKVWATVSNETRQTTVTDQSPLLPSCSVYNI